MVDLLVLLATGNADQAVLACSLVSERLDTSLAPSDLAFGYDVERCAEVAFAAFETLANHEASTSPALDLIDEMTMRQPSLLAARLASLI